MSHCGSVPLSTEKGDQRPGFEWGNLLSAGPQENIFGFAFLLNLFTVVSFMLNRETGENEFAQEVFAVGLS